MRFYQNTKGKAGYIKRKKKIQLLNAMLMALIGIIIFLIGYFLNDKSNQNVFTVVAILMALPGAKFMVSVIILLPFKSVSTESYNKVQHMLKVRGEVFADMAITSTEKVMHLEYIVVAQEHVYGLVGQKSFSIKQQGQDSGYIQKYLTKGIRGRGQNYTVKVFVNESEFNKAVSAIKEKEVNERQQQEVVSYLLSLVI